MAVDLITLTQAIRTAPPEEVVRSYLLEGIPHVFKDDPTTFDLLRNTLSDKLKVDSNDIIVVGSAKTGFSLAPDSFPRPFTPTSDIDVVVVSSDLFDMVWNTVTSWHYPRRTKSLAKPDLKWSNRRQWELYWGWFTPDRIKYKGLMTPEVLFPLRDLSTLWFNTFRGLARNPRLGARDVNGRLYRTWRHAIQYHADGIRTIASNLNQ